MFEQLSKPDINSGVFAYSTNPSLFSNDSGTPILTDNSTLKTVSDPSLVTEAQPKKNFIQQFTEWLQGGGGNELNTVTEQGVNLFNIITGKPVQNTLPLSTQNATVTNAATTNVVPDSNKTTDAPIVTSPSTATTTTTQVQETKPQNTKDWIMPAVVIGIAIVIGIVAYFISRNKNA